MSYEKCPFANEQCKYWDDKPKARSESSGCYADASHKYWPKSEYRKSKERRFVQHFVEPQCRALHDEYHALPPPDKPSSGDMDRLIAENPSGKWIGDYDERATA